MVRESQTQQKLREPWEIKIFTVKLIIFTVAGVLLAITTTMIHYVNLSVLSKDLDSVTEE